MRRTRPQLGFSLIELLVVISIVAVLIAILRPALGAARQAAREAVCGTRVKQLATVSYTIAAEQNGYFPNFGTTGPGDLDGGDPRAYFLTEAWRDTLVEDYDIPRDSLYSPTNPQWNDDALWNFVDGSKGTFAAIGYFHFGNRPGLEAKAPAIQSSEAGVTTPVFRRRIDDLNAWMPYLVTDLNRQRHDSFVNDPPRWGSNHLYREADEIRGSHTATYDGAVGWLEGGAINERYSDGNTDYWW